MKAKWIVSLGVFLNSALVFASKELGAYEFNFVAPAVYGVANAPDQVGLIIYDSSTNAFYGKGSASAGVWQALTNDATLAVPTGAILPYGGASAPAGFLLCDGSAVSRTTYASLFSAVATAFGAGDGSTTFNVPDFRGRFLRGVDGSAGNDPDKASRTAMGSGGNTGNNVGSLEGDDYKSHTHIQNAHNHGVTDPGHSHGPSGGTAFVVLNGSGSSSLPAGATATGSSATASATTGITINNATATNQNSGGNETRPVNAYVNYIIKY